MKYLQMLLWPFSLLYGCVMEVRNYLYDSGMLSSSRFNLPVIAVGNLAVGGTGKTPHVEYLLRLLQGYNRATLSRGYKRQSKGFLLADAQSTAALLGDEPFQYHRDFPGVAVAVCEERVAGIEQLRKRVPHLDVIVLDDAMQHRPVQPSLNILITDFNRPFYQDFVLPAGMLREPRHGARRADIVVVSKCPQQLKQEQQSLIKNSINQYTAPGTPVFFSSFIYGAPVRMGVAEIPGEKVVLLTGIANAQPLKDYLLEHGYQVLQHMAYPDHHQYAVQDLQKLKQLLQTPEFAQAAILTTRKDAVKLAGPELKMFTEQLPVFYIPIEVQLLEDRELFDSLVRQHVQQFKKETSI